MRADDPTDRGNKINDDVSTLYVKVAMYYYDYFFNGERDERDQFSLARHVARS